MAMSPEIWRHIFDAIDDPLFLHDEQFRTLLANRAYCREAGIPEAEALGKPYWEVFPPGAGPLPGCLGTMTEGRTGSQQEEAVSVGEKHYGSRDYMVRDEQGKLRYALHTLCDITEQRKAEAALGESEQRLRHLVSFSPAVLYTCEVSGSYPATFVSGNVRQQLGYAPEQFTDDPEFWREHIHPDDRERVFDALPRLFEHKRHVHEYRFQHADGSYRWMRDELNLLCDAAGNPQKAIGYWLDITERREAERHLARLSRMYRTISQCNQALVRAGDELELAREMCRVLVEDGGYRAAWVGYAETGAGKSIRPIAAAGIEPGEIEAMNLSWEDSEPGNGPTGSTVRSGERRVSRDILNDPLWAPFHQQAVKRGYAAAAAIPLKVNDRVLGALDIYGADADAFAPDMIDLLTELAGDIAFGISNFRVRAEHMGILEKLERSLDHAVIAIAATVEMRDPYTAGHQRRVAKLAVAIAREMGLPDDQVQGLHMAGVVHDIGKIHVPAEILASPAKLSDAEFEIIKTHPLAGHEILKVIDFPWPVAEIVYQHHEKLDGSGYPRGLKGDEILLEARILTVADVLEAMTSHRPYRPGFGIFPALQEIYRNKGKFYDAAVVEACLRLFMERDYEWE